MLGVQPPTPRTTPIRIAKTDFQEMPRMQQQPTQSIESFAIKCYKWNGDHYASECPNSPQEPQRPRLSPIERYCEGCCMEHLPRDCPIRREEFSKQDPRTSMNHIEVIPSPNNYDAEAKRASLNIVTRAQSICYAEVEIDTTKETSKQKTKKRRTCKIRSKRSKKSKGHTQESKENKEKPREKLGETSKQTQAKDEHK